MSEETGDKCEAALTIKPAVTCAMDVRLELPNRPFELPPMAVGEGLEVVFRLIGTKAMSMRESNGKLVLEVSGFTQDTVVRGQAWTLTLPEWELTRHEESPAQ